MQNLKITITIWLSSPRSPQHVIWSGGGLVSGLEGCGRDKGFHVREKDTKWKMWKRRSYTQRPIQEIQHTNNRYFRMREIIRCKEKSIKEIIEENFLVLKSDMRKRPTTIPEIFY